MTIRESHVLAQVPRPPFYRRMTIKPTYDGWHRVNLYAQVEKTHAKKGSIWALGIVASYVVRWVDGQYLDFHPTTPPSVTI